MSKRIVAGFTLFAFLTLGVPVSAGPSDVAVESSEGSITLRGDTTDWATAQSNGLAVGDSVVLGPESQVTLLFPDGSRVRVAPDSEFRLQQGGNGTPSLYLLRGRVISSVGSSLTVETYRSNAVATQGEFVLETGPTNTGLKVLSGNAHLKPNRGQKKSYDLLTSAPDTANQGLAQRAVLAFGKLASQQTVQDDGIVYGAQGKGKSQGVRQERERDKTGGVGRVAPNQDMLPPGKNPAAVAPVTNTPPVSAAPATSVPVTTPPATGVLPAVAGASPWPWILGGLGATLGAIALLTDDDGSDNVVFGGNGIGPNVPSPSLP